MNTPELTNLRVLRRSTRRPTRGDVFAMQLPDDTFLFGRVIATDAAIGPMSAVTLIYIFDTQSAAKKVPSRHDLAPTRLLLPPLFTNRLPWARGYFETIAHVPIENEEVLQQHCFFSSNRGRYFDERNRELAGAVPPVGDWGLHSYGTIDDAVSDALGLRRASP